MSQNITEVGTYNVKFSVALRYFPLAEPLELTVPVIIYGFPPTSSSPLPWILLATFTIAGIGGGFFLGMKHQQRRGGIQPIKSASVAKVMAGNEDEEKPLDNSQINKTGGIESEDPDHNLLPDKKPRIRADRRV